jgi:hypothetical protein
MTQFMVPSIANPMVPNYYIVISNSTPHNIINVVVQPHRILNYSLDRN